MKKNIYVEISTDQHVFRSQEESEKSGLPRTLESEGKSGEKILALESQGIFR